ETPPKRCCAALRRPLRAARPAPRGGGGCSGARGGGLCPPPRFSTLPHSLSAGTPPQRRLLPRSRPAAIPDCPGGQAPTPFPPPRSGPLREFRNPRRQGGPSPPAVRPRCTLGRWRDIGGMLRTVLGQGVRCPEGRTSGACHAPGRQTGDRG